MKPLSLATAVAAVVLSGCAASPQQLACLQPNRRVEVEMGGIKLKPPPKNKPKAKPGRQAVIHKAIVQGNSAWDHGKAVLHADGKKEIDKVLKLVKEGTSRDKRPTQVGSVIITGHSDAIEVSNGLTNLDEERAKAVRDYLVTKGVNPKVIFWQGSDASKPMKVTKFCEG
ncbi:MAG: OmpA family protein [Betaproteobacteria bacterium]|nr:OmpA family protein [Betaproteobacteria bacterium]